MVGILLLNGMKLPSTVIFKLLQRNFSVLIRSSSVSDYRNASPNQQQQNHYSNEMGEEEKFRVLQLVKKKRPWTARKNFNEVFFKRPREEDQSVTQEWGSVWPCIRSFHPATVPLPVRMGYPHSTSPTPPKWGNAELMKIANFLHLTPPVIKKQCDAIKGFCTPWPKELDTEEAQSYHYPMVVTTSSYVHSSPTLRDPRARVVSVRVGVDSLELDSHAEDKLLRLVGDRFNPKTREFTLVVDRCPLSSQNLEYCLYLLTVLYSEALKKEPWEHEKELDDFESYSYSVGNSRSALEHFEEKTGTPLREEHLSNYIETVTKLHDKGEDEEVLQQLRSVSLKVLNLA